MRLLRAKANDLFPERAPRPRRDGPASASQPLAGEDKVLAKTPSSLIAGWRAGPVAAPRHPDLLQNIDRLRARFPEFGRHLSMLTQLGSQVVYAGACKVPDFEACGVAVVRFSNAIETAFGITREVMFFYSPHRELQVRTFRAAKDVFGTLNREMTPDLIFVSSPDPRLRERLDDWTRGSTYLAIPFGADVDSPIGFIGLLRDYIFSRDLFYETTPVAGDSFFGRKVLLQGLGNDVLNQRVAGLFGLRKAGKTSVLKQLSLDLRRSDAFSVLVDLESLPSPPEDPIPDLLTSLRSKLISEFKSQSIRTKELSECSPTPSLAEFKHAFQSLLARLPRDNPSMIVVMLDEIEYLTPYERIDVAEGDMPQIAQFLGVMRGLVQETSNFTFIVSGLTSQIVESGRLYGRPNPLFSWAKTHHVAPFTSDEATDLALSIGSRMGIEIDRGATDALFEATGGHAYLYRSLASEVVESLPVDVFRRQMLRVDVIRSLEDWRLSIAGNLEEMIDHVKRYYPTEGVLLEFLLEEPSQFVTIANSEPKALRHLMDLGLVQRDGHAFAANPVLELL